MSVGNTGAPRNLIYDGDFILLRMSLVDALDGDFEAAIVLQRIAWRCERHGEWPATREEIQAETRLSAWKVKQALTKLRAKGWLASRRSSRADATLVWFLPPEMEDSATCPEESSASEVAESSVSEMAESSISSLEDVEHNYETKTPGADAPVLDLAVPEPPPTGPAHQATLEFAEFWDAYPRKAGKQAARKAWDRSVKKVSNSYEITEAARRFRDDPNRVDQFTPHPATWLNQGRWEDDPLPARTDGARSIDDRVRGAFDLANRIEAEDPWATPSEMIEQGRTW